MSPADREFEVEDDGSEGAPKPPAPRPSSPDPGEEALRTPVRPGAAPQPASRREHVGGASPRVRAQASAPSASGPSRKAAPASGAPAAWQFGAVRRIFYLLGACLALATVFVFMNSSFGLNAVLGWPWEQFVSRNADGTTSFFLDWNRNQAFAGEWMLAALGLLIAAILPAGRARGAFALLVTTLAFSTFYFRADVAVEDYFAITAATGPVLAGVLWLASRTRRPGARTVLAAGLLVIATGLLLPYPSRGQIDSGEAGHPQYESAVEGFVREVLNPPEGDSALEILADQSGLWMIGVLGLLVVGVLSFLGLGGRWAAVNAIVLGILLAVGVAVRLVFHAAYPDEASNAEASWKEGLLLAADALRLRFYPFILPLSAAILDLALSRRRAPAA